MIYVIIILLINEMNFLFQIFSQRPIQKEATMLCTQLLQSFSTCMEQLAFNPPLPKMESSQ